VIEKRSIDACHSECHTQDVCCAAITTGHLHCCLYEYAASHFKLWTERAKSSRRSRVGRGGNTSHELGAFVEHEVHQGVESLQTSLDCGRHQSFCHRMCMLAQEQQANSRSPHKLFISVLTLDSSHPASLARARSCFPACFSSFSWPCARSSRVFHF